MAPRFADTLGSLDGFDGLAVPDTFGPDITSAYDDDMAEATAAATAAAQADIAGIITQAVAAAVAEAIPAAVSAVKAEAFDALLGTGDEEVTDLGTEASTTVELPGDDYDESALPPATASLFQKSED